ncbi:PREDICTED: uncharacterized protein LOC105362451 [Ceratosolen solmsi marchali]|uniref:Uncharacterized protein LOC105362451 n=1 Tax=Ceratosolen solmsi marchali TaxID=326594 RepID=A0AAJ7DVS5_9HYME|nr:PREDICTED: uncharacterized protein LOC105362451 [Ceratosolen solmsi marchali]
MRIASCYFKRLVLIIGLTILIFCLIQFLKFEITFYDRNDRNDKLDGSPACKLPRLDIFNPEIMKFIHDVPPLQCSPEDWVKAEGSKLFIDKNAKNQYGQITCSFNEILRVDDYNYILTDTVETDKFYVLRKSDYAEVNCKTQTGKRWHTIIAAVRDDPERKRDVTWSKVPREALNLNILMFGFDSLSQNTFARKLPRSNRYLRQNLDSIILKGYNIVGDGTPQALIPILTGKIELELPETRKRMGAKAHYVNVYPMIWKDYKQAGFITGFMEDVHHIGTFTYRLKGFDEQPTDHYMRTYYLAASPHFKYSKSFCMGGIPRHLVMMNHIKSIFNKYKDQPKFIFGFHGELSHDSYNDIGVADDDVLHWIKDLKESGHLNNTILILMSDHGHRFAEIRNTLQGKQEERLPFFSFTFPPWFKKNYPQAYANFLFNAQHLTTPFDIHVTLKHILNFKEPKEGDIRNRGISLFDKIPLKRTCSDAFIEPHWCVCLSWLEIPLDQEVVQKAAQYLLKFLNSYTENHRDICEKLRLGQILWAAKLIPTKGILHFQKSRDTDGFVSELSAKTKLTTELYQLKIKALPGKGLFEASISRDINKNIFFTRISDISRINMYGSQAKCVENSLFHLRKYCYCKE